LLQRLSQGALRNVRFADLLDLVQGFGFCLSRISGSHHSFSHPDIPEPVNLEEIRGEAKAYQYMDGRRESHEGRVSTDLQRPEGVWGETRWLLL
jgi:hypothetical protein